MFFNKQITLKRTTLICLFLVTLLIGLYLARFTTPLSGLWLVLVVLLVPLLLGNRPVIISYILLAGLIVGWWRGGVLQAQNQLYRQSYYKNVSIVGRSTEDSFYANNSQLQFTVESISIDGKRLPGKIQVRGFGEAMVYRHDIVVVKGKMYPSRGGKQATISFAQLNVIARAKSPIEDLRRNFIAGMESALPEPAASFAVGLLVGQRSLLSTDVSNILLVAGLTHIVAVSGYNLTIIVQAVRRMLHKFSRFQILAISLSLIYLFLLITGYSPSIIRASIVSSLGLLAWYFGRTFRPILLILLAAAITAFVNPYYVWGDVGWYLSFLAFFGVLILAPLLTTRIFGDRNVWLIASVAIESFSAQILTLPLIIMIFGRISLVGLLANIVVVPMVPVAMLLALIAGMAGAIMPTIAGWLALPARIWLNIMLLATAWFAKWPAAQISSKISIANFVEMYAIITVFIMGLKRRAISVKINSSKTIGRS